MIPRFALVILAALGGCLVACPQAIPVVAPVASCVSFVVSDALQGMTIDQIVNAAGPGCVADAEDVITILLGSSDPRLPSTVAYKSALARRPKP